MADTCVCPSCQRELRVPKELWGTPVRCPKCDKTFVAQVDNSLGWEEPPIPEGKELAEEKPPRRRRPRRDEEDEEDEDWPRRRREEYFHG